MPRADNDFKPDHQSTRAQRRRWKAMARERNENLARFHRDARWFPGGPKQAQATVFRPEYVFDIAVAVAAADGHRDTKTKWIVSSVARFIKECVSYSPGEGFQCLCCETCFSASVLPDAVVLMAHVKSDETTIVTGVCVRCSSVRSDAELAQAHCRYFGKVWPGATVVGAL